MRGLYAAFTSPAFAVILALLLVGFVISGQITIIVSASVYAAWLVASLSVAKIEWVNKQRIGRRLLIVIAAGLIMGIGANHYVKWCLFHYAKNLPKPETAAAPAPTDDQLAYSRMKSLFEEELRKNSPPPPPAQHSQPPTLTIRDVHVFGTDDIGGKVKIELDVDTDAKNAIDMVEYRGNGLKLIPTDVTERAKFEDSLWEYFVSDSVKSAVPMQFPGSNKTVALDTETPPLTPEQLELWKTPNYGWYFMYHIVDLRGRTMRDFCAYVEKNGTLTYCRSHNGP